MSEEVWYRVIQIVINRDDVQGYAAKTVFEVSRIAETKYGIQNFTKNMFPFKMFPLCEVQIPCPGEI